MMLDSQSNALWVAWQEDPNDAVRGQLVDFYLPFARMIAAKIYARRTFRELEFMDYFQCASVGLIEAIERYNPAQGVSFETFATLRIKGAILSGVATLSEKQEQVSARRRVIDSRVQALNTCPKIDASLASPVSPVSPVAPASAAAVIAAKSEDGAMEDIFVQLAELAIGLALGFALEDTGMVQTEEVPHYQDNSYQRLEMKQLKQQLHHLLDALPSNENRVLTYHYLQHLGFAEIARILKMSAGRISQIHKAALTRLRDTMQVRNRIDLHY